MKEGDFDRHEDHFALSTKRKLAFGSGGFGQAVMEDVVNNWILIFYNTVLMVRADWIGWAFMGTRLWDAVSDPLMGHISDNARTRWGRRRPFMLLGALLMAAAFVAMCVPPSGLSKTGLFAYLAAIAFLYFTGWTITIIPYSSLGAELTLDYHERTRLNAFRSFLNRVGAILAGSCFFFAGLFPDLRTGFAVVGVVFGVLGALGFVVTFLGTREEGSVQRQEKVGFWPGFRVTVRNGPFWMITGILFFILTGVLLGFPAGHYVVMYYVVPGDAAAFGRLTLVNTVVFNLVCFAAVFGLTRFGVRFGKERALLLSTVLFAAAPLMSWFLFTPAFPYLVVLFQVPVAIALTGVMMYAQAMVADLVDLDELVTFTRREGSYLSVMSFFAKLASPFALWGFTQLQVHWAHFAEQAATQTPETILRLRLILMVAPLAPFGVAILLALLYPVKERHVREARAILEERRAAGSPGTSDVGWKDLASGPRVV